MHLSLQSVAQHLARLAKLGLERRDARLCYLSTGLCCLGTVFEPEHPSSCA